MRPRTLHVVGLLGLLNACSFLNRDGPEQSCPELAGGTACRDGIIASCPDGTDVEYVVCDDVKACEEPWQVNGLFRCEEGDPLPTTGAGTGGGGTGSTADAVAVCSSACPAGYSQVAQVVNDACGGCSCGLANPGECSQTLCVRDDLASSVAVSTSAEGCVNGEPLLSATSKCAPNGVAHVCSTQ